jgi:RNA 2',3'-cyclic 3'-phosphodiesterase
MRSSTLRLFFALWPDEPTLAASEALGREAALSSGGRAMPPQNIHVTLAFLGSQPAARVEHIANVAGGIDGETFDLVLDRIGFWRKSGIAWLGSGIVPASLTALHRGLATGLSTLDIRLEDRAFHPHVTLARNATTPVSSVVRPPIVWRVEAFALVASEVGTTGSVYRRLEQWPLRTSASNAADLGDCTDHSTLGASPRNRT